MTSESVSTQVLEIISNQLPELDQSVAWRELDPKDRESPYLALGTATTILTTLSAGALTPELLRRYCAVLEALASMNQPEVDDVIVTSALHLLDSGTIVGHRVLAALGPAVQRLLPWMTESRPLKS